MIVATVIVASAVVFAIAVVIVAIAVVFAIAVVIVAIVSIVVGVVSVGVLGMMVAVVNAAMICRAMVRNIVIHSKFSSLSSLNHRRLILDLIE